MSSTRLLVLGVVQIFQPVHGYDVRRELLSWRANEWASISPGSIYNALKTLTRDGLLEVVGTEQAGARPERTTYRLTSEGQAELGHLLRDAWWHVQPVIDPLMPAMSLMAGMRREELIAALRSRIQQIGTQQAQTRFWLRQPKPETMPDHVQEMMLLMDARLAAELDWAAALIAKLERGEYHTADDPPWAPPPTATPRRGARPARPASPARPAKKAGSDGKKRTARRRT